MVSPALKIAPSLGEVITAVGSDPTEILMGSDDTESLPSDTTSVAVYSPLTV